MTADKDLNNKGGGKLITIKKVCAKEGWGALYKGRTIARKGGTKEERATCYKVRKGEVETVRNRRTELGRQRKREIARSNSKQPP